MNQTLPQIFRAARTRPADWIAVKFKKDGRWISLGWREYSDLAESFACYLVMNGVQPGDRVAVFAETQLAWAVADLGILSAGAVTVPIYANGIAEELQHILSDSGASLLLIGAGTQMQKWNEIKGKNNQIKTVLNFEDGSWSSALSAGKEYLNRHPSTVDERVKSARAEDIASIVYTSGTSGLPKGVVITHRQILSEIEDLAKVFPVDNRDCTLSFLPYAHVLGRVEMWLSIQAGYTLAFAESIDRMKNNLPEVSPTALIAVPRIFEKIYAAVAGQLEKKPVLNAFFQTIERFSGKAASFLKGKLLSSKMKEAFGGRVRFAISGGARLDPEIGAFFAAAGIPIYEGYGLTESTGAICVNTPQKHRFGTVGQPLPEVKIRLADDGEILVKSDKIMRSYYKEKTEFSNGYFATGDIGRFEDGFLTITDRKKDLIKTSGGKYVAPQKLENALKRDPLISQALIHGDQRKYIVALITLNEAELRLWAKSKNLPIQSYDLLTRSEEVKVAVAKAVAKANSDLASYETIKKFAVLDHEFTVADGELTPSLKIKRKFCDQKYRPLIDALY